MPSKQLVDLVTKLKSSGIQISFTKPRSKMSLHLYNDFGSPDKLNEFTRKNKNNNRSIFEYI